MKSASLVSAGTTGRWRGGFVLGLLLFAASSGAQAALRLPALFADHMVLQGGRPVPCWGWAEPQAPIDLVFKETGSGRSFSVSTVTAESGRWAAWLPALPVGAAGTLQIQGGGETRRVDDVVVGEVWLGSGQSNMTYRVGAPDFPARVLEIARTEAAAAMAKIRVFMVVQEGSDQPRDDVRGKWQIMDETTVAACPAVAWNFAWSLNRGLKRPVGVIVSGHGGTPVESWISRETLDALPVAGKVWSRHQELLARYPEAKKAYDEALAGWERENPTVELKKKNVGGKPTLPYSAVSSKVPVRLFNAMIQGLAPFGIQGVIWYQGEENSGRAQEYAPLICALVTSWRKHWGVEWPFYYVELANTRQPQTKPAEGGWGLIREAQASVLSLSRTGVVTAVDLGDGKIHPWNKKAVGERLAALALAEVHGRGTAEVHSPEYASHEIQVGRVRVKLAHAGGLRARGDGLVRGFALAGQDGVWRWAEAKVSGEEIEVWNPAIPVPVAVCYGWASNPVLSLENDAGLPLRPFRTNPGHF